MDLDRQSLSGNDIAAALDWWREAGVDCAFADEPAGWLPQVQAELEQPIELKSAAPAPSRPAIDRSTLPGDLAAFGEWWLTEPSLDNGQTNGRIAPRGAAGAEIMVLVAFPEAEDRDLLLSGPLGKFLDAILGAMQITPEQAYFASVLPRHTPHPDWATLQTDGIGEVLAHHIGLVSPKRLIVFGQNILPLLGHDPANSADNLPRFNHEGRDIPMLPAMELGVLLSAPRRKASFWQRWLDWTG
jgi:DNA polymerase